MRTSPSLHLPSSSLQAGLASELDRSRKLLLQEALGETLRRIRLSRVNAELDKLAPEEALTALAASGVRGEFVFAVPYILTANPRLLGYYRLLLGFSQKEFYQKSGLQRFKAMEDSGILRKETTKELRTLCSALNKRATEMIESIGVDRISKELLHELTLLTLGPQLRGGRNTRIGTDANNAVFDLIRQTVAPGQPSSVKTGIELLNAAGRMVRIQFAADPDIAVSEAISAKQVKPIIAIEIKGGTDGSNIWNRLGEAEKSHQTAKHRGFTEFWTIYNVDAIDLATARQKSPTTSRFYCLSQLLDQRSPEFEDFRDRLIAAVGIASRSPKP